MTRKVIDTYPELRVTLGPAWAFQSRWDRPRSIREADDFWALVKRHVLPHFDGLAEVDTHMVEEAVCQHCNWRWTEDSPEYNGGCCAMDEANNPERLATLATLIDEVEGGDFYRWDADRGRDRGKVDWPWALASAADLWLKAGRPVEGVERIVSLTKNVRNSDWCTIWEDPGPSGCSLARLPDEVTRDARPVDLADELLSLIDDMGMMPVAMTEAR